MRKQFELESSLTIRRVVAAVLSAAAFASMAASAADESKKKEDVTTLSDMEVVEDPLRAIPTEPSNTAFGFSKPLLETPRSVSFLSEEQLTLFGVNTVQDLVRVVPGVYTTTRYGLQGGINVRGVTADQYFRGMKRLSLQGHVRTVLSAMDSIEVVKGPPSPLYGMGKIGGYTNLIPKSSRAKTGTYLTEDQGFIQGTTGSYDKAEVQFGVGGPVQLGSKQGGYYIFGLMENSNTYIEQVDAKQKFVQATTSVDNFIGPFRLETGGQLQQSVTSGAYMNRATQNLIDHGQYITGSPLANLDLNSDGSVSPTEAYFASPVTGAISTSNMYLSQRINPIVNSAGQLAYAPLVDAQGRPEIPITMLNYLNQHTEISCSMANYMRTAGQPGSTLGVSQTLPGTTRQLPVGFALNPCTTAQNATGTVPVNYRRDGSFEREQNAKQNLLYLDLIYDTDPDFTAKNQLYYDRLDSFKDSNMPYGEKQDIHAFEEKITVTRKIPQEHLPSWFSMEALASINYRDTRGNIHSSSGDFDYRQDIMRGTGLLYANNTFVNQLNSQDYVTGAPITSNLTSAYQETGLGLLLDMDFFKNTNLLAGGRFDYSEARAQQFAGFNASLGTAPTLTGPTAGQTLDAQLAAITSCANQFAQALKTTPLQTYPYPVALSGAGYPNYNAAPYALTVPGCPGAYIGPLAKAKGYDHAPSWSFSLSQKLPFGIVPYVTVAHESLTLDGSNNIIQPSVIWQQNPVTPTHGHLGQAQLKEVGIKANLLGGKLFLAADGYEQTRNDVTANVDPSAAADVNAIKYRGVEFEFKWVPIKELYLGGYVLGETGRYTVDATFNAEVDGRQLGFQDVIDPNTGNRYPAEAFLYGGRFAAIIPAGQSQYRDRAGDPQIQAGLNGTYKLPAGFGVLFSSNYFDAVWANRTKTIRLPRAITADAGITYDKDKWQLRLSGYNIFNERYWQAAASDANAVLVTAKPGATWELMARKSF